MPKGRTTSQEPETPRRYQLRRTNLGDQTDIVSTMSKAYHNMSMIDAEALPGTSKGEYSEVLEVEADAPNDVLSEKDEDDPEIQEEDKSDAESSDDGEDYVQARPLSKVHAVKLDPALSTPDAAQAAVTLVQKVLKAVGLQGEVALKESIICVSILEPELSPCGTPPRAESRPRSMSPLPEISRVGAATGPPVATNAPTPKKYKSDCTPTIGVVVSNYNKTRTRRHEIPKPYASVSAEEAVKTHLRSQKILLKEMLVWDMTTAVYA